MRAFIIALCSMLLAGANLLWGSDSNISTIGSIVVGVVPSIIYIVQAFAVKIKAADTNKDGKVTIDEIAAAIKYALADCTDEIKAVGAAVETVVGVVTAIEGDEE